MSIRSLARVARLVGFVSPLITAPAAGTDLEPGALALVVHSETPAASGARPLAAVAIPDACRARRDSL